MSFLYQGTVSLGGSGGSERVSSEEGRKDNGSSIAGVSIVRLIVNSLEVREALVTTKS